MVICDTNIFYDIDSGAIAKAWFEKDQLVGAMPSQMEFAKSYKLIDKIKEVKGAAKAMNNHCTHIINLSPPDFAIRRILPDYEPLPNSFETVRASYDMLLKENFELRPAMKHLGKQIIDNYEQPFRELVSNENIRLGKRPKIKKAIKEGIKAMDFTTKSKKEVIEDLQQHHSQNFPNTPITIDENDAGWQNLEFFIHVYTDYHKIFIERDTKKVKDNDIIDLAMTMYVGRSDLFWTNEDFWIKLIKANPITAKYLYHCSGRTRQI